MSNKLIYLTGILGVTLFGVASILGGFQFDEYNPISQYISETMAVDTPYGKELRLFGYIPAGILLTLFSFAAYKKLPTSNLVKIGFWGLGIFYGIATIIVGLFPCDKGCNKDFINPSISQIIHTLTGMLTYIFVPISILFIGIGLWKSKAYSNLSKISLFCSIFCSILICLLMSNSFQNYAGLLQRVIEGTFIFWIIASAIFVKRSTL